MNGNNMLFHIGYHKTGTSWLQNNLFTHEGGVFYPVEGGGEKNPGKSNFAKDFIYDEKGYYLSQNDLNEQVILKKAKSQEISSDLIPVISNERLSGNAECSGIDSFSIANRIHGSFPDAKILIMIRNQSDILKSWYFQYLLNGGSLSIRRYLKPKRDGFGLSFSPKHFEYFHLVRYYFELFGEENVMVVPYEIFKYHFEDFIISLNKFLKIELSSIDFDKNEKINHSVKRAKYFIKRRFNKYNGYSNSINHFYEPNFVERGFNRTLEKIIEACLTERKEQEIENYVKNVIQDEFGDFYIESNKLLSSLIGVDLSLYGYEV